MDKKATFFEFTKYDFTPGQQRVFFHYKTEFDDGNVVNWTETIILPKPVDHIPTILLESLHIMLGISYWKFYPSFIVRQPYQLTKPQANFWNTVYKKGLGEFFYRNALDPKISPKFSFENTTQPIPTSSSKLLTSSLVGIGGGKDSIVTAELLKEAGFDFDSFFVGNKPEEPVVDDVIKLVGKPALKIQRRLDPKVHEKHAYNGHVPVSAIYAFLGILSCVLYDYKYFIVSNEHSSNFGNIKYKGLDINHQWSKSLEFELLFSEYVKNYISPDVGYFSLLRPLYEIRIVKLFTKYPKYFRHFSSCNRNFTLAHRSLGEGGTGRWCGNCAKCVFAFTLLSAFLSKKELLGIFGQNLYARKDLLPIFKDILGLGTMKPFDCVGTFEEAQTAFSMAKQKFLKTKIHPDVFTTAAENVVPDHLKLLGMETVFINRAEGLEGGVVKKFLKKQYPKIKILASPTGGKTGETDITIKTPGINKSQIKGLYTTPTNIFFSQIKGKNTIIGVTGSKGKSTTTSLIGAILKEAGKTVQVLGNIGIPMLGALLQPIAKDTIFVLELSSFQLDDIKFSPDIAVVTNLFPEHMDFHGSLKNYYAAKKNVLKFQSLNDHAIFCVKASQTYQTNLLGAHNQNNIEAAVQVARILHIPEETIARTVKNFEGLPHRLQNLGTFKGITFYDDAISTTPESTVMAIKSIFAIGTIFLGGQDRGYDFSPLEKALKKYKIKNVVLFPDSGKKMLRNTKGFNILKTKSMEEAVTFAYKYTKPGEVCLLSCASPSYSLWKNFEEKGDQFKRYVIQLASK